MSDDMTMGKSDVEWQRVWLGGRQIEYKSNGY